MRSASARTIEPTPSRPRYRAGRSRAATAGCAEVPAREARAAPTNQRQEAGRCREGIDSSSQRPSNAIRCQHSSTKKIISASYRRMCGASSSSGSFDSSRLGGGTVFELSGSTLQTLYAFCSEATCLDGEYRRPALSWIPAGTCWAPPGKAAKIPSARMKETAQSSN